MFDNELFFPRGSTASQGVTAVPPAGVQGANQSLVPTATGNYAGATPYRRDLGGKTVTVLTSKAMGDPTDGEEITLRAMQLYADVTIGTTTNALLGCSTTATEFGKVTAAASDGGPALAIDYAYVTLNPGGTLKKWDWAWFVEEGPVKITVGTQPSAQGAVSSDSSGYIKASAAGKAVVGTAEAATVSGLAVVYMRPLFTQAQEA